MILNEEGKTFLEYARRILNEAEKAKAEICTPASSVSGIVNVGLLPSTTDLLASMLVNNLRQHFPGIRLTITSGHAGHLQEWLEVGEIDIALLYSTRLSPALSVRPLVQEALWFVGPPNSNLRNNKPLALIDVIEKPMILPSRPHGLRAVVDQVGQKNDLQFKVVAETNSMSIQKRLVLDGLGFTILPSIAIADDLEAGLLEASPLVDSGLTRTIVSAHLTSRNMTTPVRCVRDELSRCIENCIETGRWSHATWVAEQ